MCLYLLISVETSLFFSRLTSLSTNFLVFLGCALMEINQTILNIQIMVENNILGIFHINFLRNRALAGQNRDIVFSALRKCIVVVQTIFHRVLNAIRFS